MDDHILLPDAQSNLETTPPIVAQTLPSSSTVAGATSPPISPQRPVVGKKVQFPGGEAKTLAKKARRSDDDAEKRKALLTGDKRLDGYPMDCEVNIGVIPRVYLGCMNGKLSLECRTKRSIIPSAVAA